MDAALARPHAVPERGGNGLAIVLAVAMHVMLGALLFFGIRWQSSAPATVEAELWSATPQTAAPRAVSSPLPVVPPTPTPTPPPVVQPEPPQPKADIVEKTPEKVIPKKAEVKPVLKPDPPKARPVPVPPPVAKVEPPQKPIQKPLPKEAPPRAPSDLAALMAQAEGPGPATSSGRDQQTSGPRGNAGYISRLVTAIRSQMRYPASSAGNPFASVRIEQLPTGEVVNVTLTKSSGVPAFDAAVERAIQAASPLPRDTDGHAERTLSVDYYMYEKS